MELREWLIILGLVLVTIIAIDGMRRLQRQRRVPRLDQVAAGDDSSEVDPEEAARQAQINWELPYGGPRVVRPAVESTDKTKPSSQDRKLSSSFKGASHTSDAARKPGSDDSSAYAAYKTEQNTPRPQTNLDESPTAGGRFSRAGMSAALRAGSQRVSKSVQQVSSALNGREESEHLHREPSLGEPDEITAGNSEQETPNRQDSERLSPQEAQPEVAETIDKHLHAENTEPAPAEEANPIPSAHDEVITPHPVIEKARRHHVSAQRASETLAHFEEVIVISVMARNEEGFSGPDLLNLMLACGLRYSEMSIFLRYETEEADSELQFAMVDVVKPGIFDLGAMDDFATPGVTFLMPLPGARDSAAAFEAMFETAMVLVRNLGGELKDENRSVMTAQTIEFARQRVQEFERRHRLHRYQVN